MLGINSERDTAKGRTRLTILPWVELWVTFCLHSLLILLMKKKNSKRQSSLYNSHLNRYQNRQVKYLVLHRGNIIRKTWENTFVILESGLLCRPSIDNLQNKNKFNYIKERYTICREKNSLKVKRLIIIVSIPGFSNKKKQIKHQ